MRKVPKRIWYGDELWDVVRTLRPTKADVYLLAQRKVVETTHYATGTPVDLVLIDVGNDTFYPDTLEVRRLIEIKKEKALQVRDCEKELDEHWFEVVDTLTKGK